MYFQNQPHPNEKWEHHIPNYDKTVTALLHANLGRNKHPRIFISGTYYV